MSVTPTTPLVSTTGNRSTFTGRVSDLRGDWAMAHLTTYTGSEPDPIPTDHGCLLRDGETYRVIITDGIGHHDPKAIGAVAADVLDEVSKLSIAQQIDWARSKWGGELPEEKAYQCYLKSLTRAYKNRDRTTLLQVEVSRLGTKHIRLTIGKCGDPDVVILDRKGNVRFATVDTKHYLKPDGVEVGLLAIGGNFSEKWLDDSTYIKTEIKVKEAFVIACSDGLTECLRNSDGSIDRDRFRYAALTGGSLFQDEPIPPVPSLNLTARMITEHLQQAASAFAQRMRERSQIELRARSIDPTHLEAELKRIHAGDDTTILTLALSKDPQSQAACSSSSGMIGDGGEVYYRVFGDAFERKDHEELALLNIQAEEELNYDAVASSYAQTVALNLDELSAHCSLDNFKLTLKEAKEALKHHKEKLRLLKEKHGDDPHPDIAMTLNFLGRVYTYLGKATKALVYFEQSLATYELIYGDNPHPNIAITLSHLGGAYRNLGGSDESIVFYEQSLAMYKLIYGDVPHPNIAINLGYLGNSYKALGNVKKAMVYYNQDLAMKNLIYGEEYHPTYATTFRNLGCAYLDLGREGTAIVYFETSLDMEKLVCGGKVDLDVTTTLDILGDAYKNLGEANQAIIYFERSLAIKRIIYSDQPHSSIINTLNNLGATFIDLGDVNKAISYYEESLAMRKLIYGDKPHPDIAITLCNMGDAYKQLGDTVNSIAYFEQSLLLYQQIHNGKQHLDIAKTLNSLGSAYREQGEAKKSIDYSL